MLDEQVIDLDMFERDVYVLSAMLLADEKVVKVEHVVDAALAHYSGEVNRLLILLATAARQIMRRYRGDDEIMSIQDRNCGKRWGDSTRTDKASKPLRFFQACNSMIHATTIAAYDIKAEHYIDTIRIFEEENRDGVKPNALLDGMEFAKCCILLSRQARGDKQEKADAGDMPEAN